MDNFPTKTSRVWCHTPEECEFIIRPFQVEAAQTQRSFLWPSLISMARSLISCVRNIVVLHTWLNHTHPRIRWNLLIGRLLSYHWIPSKNNNGLITLIEFSLACNANSTSGPLPSRDVSTYECPYFLTSTTSHDIWWQHRSKRRIVPKRALLCFDGHRGI